MDKKELIYLLNKIKKDEIDINKAADLLSSIYYEDIGFAKIDHDRKSRTGYPEVIYCEGKSKGQIHRIIERMVEFEENVLGTRLSEEKYEYLRRHFPKLRYHRESKMMKIENKKIKMTGKGKIVVLTGGTSDIAIAEEAAITAEFFGNEVQRIYDVGIAGIHRLFDRLEEIRKARVIIAVAGMEGALPGIVGGLVKSPVIAVPTSIGYGSNFSGIAPLLSMLNACSPGVSVVNIDNGFGAGYLAGNINHM